MKTVTPDTTADTPTRPPSVGDVVICHHDPVRPEYDGTRVASVPGIVTRIHKQAYIGATIVRVTVVVFGGYQPAVPYDLEYSPVPRDGSFCWPKPD